MKHITDIPAPRPEKIPMDKEHKRKDRRDKIKAQK
jgi:hypothetical protein